MSLEEFGIPDGKIDIEALRKHHADSMQARAGRRYAPQDLPILGKLLQGQVELLAAPKPKRNGYGHVRLYGGLLVSTFRPEMKSRDVVAVMLDTDDRSYKLSDGTDVTVDFTYFGRQKVMDRWGSGSFTDGILSLAQSYAYYHVPGPDQSGANDERPELSQDNFIVDQPGHAIILRSLFGSKQPEVSPETSGR
jgi:hypothetical protein